MIDLHVHSTRSDGTLSPTELVDYAMKKGLHAFALTDHDSVEGLREAMDHAKQLRETLPESTAATVPEVIPGIELSTDYKGREVHIVGLFIHPENAEFQAYLKEFIESRTNRNLKMCEKFRELGIELTYQELLDEFPNAIITRAHYARHLTEMGVVKNNNEAFERFLGDRCPCYVPREKITPMKGVELIRKAGGFPVFAHPILCRFSDAKLEELIIQLKEAGLMGIEAIYSTYSPSEERQIRNLAEKYDLLISGGSDFHGANKPDIDLGTGRGNLYVDDSVLTAIKARLSAITE